MLIDLHTHTAPRSYDALQSPEELVLEAKGLGLDALCLTEHDAFWNQAELAELSRRHGLLLLPGCEVNTDEGHFLAFGLREYRFGMHRLPFLRRLVEEAGGALVAAHPYRRRGIGEASPEQVELKLSRAAQEEGIRLCHAIEGLNGRGTREENRFSANLARRLGLKTTAGSDSHRRGDLGVCATRFTARVQSVDDLIGELKAGRFSPVCLKDAGV